MILWDGTDMHEAPPAPEGCWGDRRGEDCGGAVVSPLGLCVSCLVRLGGERPVMPIPAPPSEAFVTGAGRR